MLYKKIDKSSLDSIPYGLDLFTIPLTQVAIEKVYEREFITLNPVEEAPFNFKIKTGSSFLDPTKTRIVTQWRMKKPAANPDDKPVKVESTDQVGVVNGLGAVWIKNLKVHLCGQQIFNSNNLYPYKAYLDNELNFSEDSKQSSMSAFGYYYHNKGKSTVASDAWKEGRDSFVGGNIVEYSAPLYADIFQQPHFLPSSSELEMEIHPQSNEFLIHVNHTANTAYTGKPFLELVSVRIYATFVDLHPGVALEIERKLDHDVFKYPIRRTELKTIFLDHEKTEAQSTAFSDFIPRRMNVAMVAKRAFNGSYTTDPFYFKHFNIRDITIKAGNMTIPNIPFDANIPEGRYVRMFEHLHRTVGLSGHNMDCMINRKMFLDGYTIFPFNTTTSQEDDDGFDFVRDGPTMIMTQYNEEIPEGGVMMVVTGEWDSIMFIDKTRTVRTDLSI